MNTAQLAFGFTDDGLVFMRVDMQDTDGRPFQRTFHWNAANARKIANIIHENADKCEGKKPTIHPRIIP